MSDDDADATTAAAPDSGRDGVPLFYSGDLVAGRFRVVREIAEGGMGVVYEVVDEKLNERRAMKCAKPGYAGHLPPEARHSLRVTHPNVCRVFEIHSAETAAGSIDFLTMEFIDGMTLSTAIRGGRPLSDADARTVATQICAGVAAAHARGVLHRDLKSNNVLLTKDQDGRMRAVVTDFGLAQEPSAGERGPLFSGVAGTAEYIAPERYAGARATVASDIYALGIVLHEIASGHRPEVRGAVADGDRVLAPALPARWRKVIARCLDRDPRRRYETVTEVGQALSGSSVWRRTLPVTLTAAVAGAILLWRFSLTATPEARLAILPLELKDADVQTTALMQGVSYDVSEELRHVRPRPLQLVVIPIEQTRGLPPGGTDQVQAARTRLGATHVLRGVVTQRGDVLTLHGAIVDTASAVAVREWDQDYRASDAGAVAPALTAMVAAAFRLPRQAPRERVAPAAYPAYAAGLAALRRGGGGGAAIEAIASLEQAVALDPAAVAPRAVLAEASAVAYDATRDASWLTRGRDALAQAESLNPDAIPVHLAAGRLNEVAAAYDRAAGTTRATELDASNADAWRGLARTYQAMQGHDADAAHAFQTAIDVQPKYFAPLNDYADFQRLRGNYTQAEALWRRAADLAPDSLAAHANLGGLYSDMVRYADAERELRRALAIDDRARQVLNNLGSLYQYMTRDNDAAITFERARKMGFESAALLLNLGDSYRRLDRHTDAAAAYRQGRVLADEQLLKNPRDAAIRSFVAYFNLRLGDRAMADRELTQALSLEPQNRTVIRRAAICYEAWGQRDRTLAVLQSASPDVLKELSRQPDLTALRGDPRFKALLPVSRWKKDRSHLANIKIVQKGNHIEPEAGVQFQVRATELVTFTTETDKGAKGLTITFVDRSPFDRKVVPYGTPLQIVAPVDADRNKNKYPFVCEMTINGQPFKSGPPSGGEMEVIKTEI